MPGKDSHVMFKLWNHDLYKKLNLSIISNKMLSMLTSGFDSENYLMYLTPSSFLSHTPLNHAPHKFSKSYEAFANETKQFLIYYNSIFNCFSQFTYNIT